MKKAPESIHIRRMQERDIPAVCAIHSDVLPTVTARSGPTILKKFYKTLISYPELHHLFVAEQNSRIIGAICATEDSHKTMNHIFRALIHPSAVWSVLKAIITGKIGIRDLFERKQMEDALHALTPPPYQTILTLLVSEKSQKKGIGSRLLYELEHSFPRKSQLFVDTEETNSTARAFYEAKGFTKVTTVVSSVLYTKHLP